MILKNLVRPVIIALSTTVLFVLARIIIGRRLKKQLSALRTMKQDMCRHIDPSETIFVSIASYRDPECHLTVFDCLEKADCPLRIFIGVCQQNYAIDVDVLEGYSRIAKRRGTGNYRDQIRVLDLDAGQAQGPMYARSVIEQNLYHGERYYLITDSHMLFTPGWDTRVIKMLKKCPSSQPVLTMYPDNFDHRPSNMSFFNASKLKLTPPAYLRFKQFNEKTGLPEIEGPLCSKCPDQPLPSLFWGACFSFGYASMIKQVPYDPHCPYVFMGEEISMAARLYTSGYDLYCPTDMLVKHMWKRPRPTFWEQFVGDSETHKKRQILEHKGYRRLRHLFQLQTLQPGDTALGQYGLGNKRSLSQYEEYCGISFLLQTVENHAQMGLSRGASPEEKMCKLGTLMR